MPQFDFNNPLGKIAKCQFCIHLQKKGQLPACCDVCPTGASLFGPVKELEKEIERRLTAAPGTPHEFPRGKIGENRPPNAATIPHYVKGVYGEHEAGGTQVRYLAGIPFPKLGLPTVWAAVPRLARRRHAAHALSLADRAGRRLRSDSHSLPAAIWLEHDDNDEAPKS